MKEGQYQYRVVNWQYYDKLRTEEDRREYNRRKQAEYRAKKKPLRGETAYAQAMRNGASNAELDRMVTQGLPEPKSVERNITVVETSPAGDTNSEMTVEEFRKWAQERGMSQQEIEDHIGRQ